MTPQEAFDLWDSGVLPDELQSRLTNKIAERTGLNQIAKPVRLKVWKVGSARKKWHIWVPSFLYVQGEDVWRQYFIEDGCKFERVPI